MPPAMKEVFFGQNIKGTEESDIVLSLKREKKNQGTKQTVFISAVVVCPADMMSTVLS